MGKTSSTPRKVSCLPCRLKKVKCDGQKPCYRCQQKQIECSYAKPAPVGRPPKNAVVNKLVLARSDAPAAYFSSTLCKEFIFEHISYGHPGTQGNYAPYLYDNNRKDNEPGIRIWVKSIYQQYFGGDNVAANAITTRHDMDPSKLAGAVKMYDLLQHFTWTTSDVVNIVVRRFSRLTLLSYVEPAFTMCGLALDKTQDFFDGHQAPPINPLNSLPPQQALRLIECFFSIHPYSNLFNKTMLLQSYWTDSADPFLMTIIYGTTAYISQLLDGKPLSLWETSLSASQRNPFLDYAYVLIDKANTEVSLSRYQAVVLLALFESQFGYTKRGMTLFALSYMMAARMGILDGTYKKRQMTDVEEELLLMTYWASYNMTVRGCIELDQVPREVIGKFSRSFPPASIHDSASYKFDRSNGNLRMFKSYHYLVETYFTESVITQYSSRLFMYFPESDYNLFRVPQYINALSSHSTALSAPIIDIEQALKNVLINFETFIHEHKHEWSPLQVFSIESTYLLYKIHFSFLRLYVSTARLQPDNRLGLAPIATRSDRHTEDTLDLDDIDVIIRLHSVVPIAVELLDKMKILLDNPANYCCHPEWLPHGLMASCLETSARILMLKYRRDPWDIKTYNHIKTMHKVTTYQIWIGWTAIQTIEKMLNDFFKMYPVAPVGEEQVDTSTIINDNSFPVDDNELAILTSTIQIPVEMYDFLNNSSNVENTSSSDERSTTPYSDVSPQDIIGFGTTKENTRTLSMSLDPWRFAQRPRSAHLVELEEEDTTWLDEMLQAGNDQQATLDALLAADNGLLNSLL
ncbi:hypothetical protein LRAMOSA08771 [Lichtheimia ramosa]|uniref:Zn(2)-C6 fungal-type domain-containing protein n=1 Tax=Lichtheimia ramosa TaxID=688394 RepID=A0A077WGQ2_9FUNG|nr:hypothetical protein LRAMOSA08771 [Lichtheimia ramosa]